MSRNAEEKTSSSGDSDNDSYNSDNDSYNSEYALSLLQYYVEEKEFETVHSKLYNDASVGPSYPEVPWSLLDLAYGLHDPTQGVNKEMVALLRAFGAEETQYKEQKPWTPSQIAVITYNDRKLLELMYTNEFSNDMTEEGFSPLHLAVLVGNLRAAELMVKYLGADPAQPTEQGRTCFQLTELLSRYPSTYWLMRKALTEQPVDRSLESGAFLSPDLEDQERLQRR